MEDLNKNAKEVKVKRTRKVAAKAAPVVKATQPHVGDTQGKATNPVVVAMPLSIAKEADLKARANDVNDFNISGKKEGSVLVTENFEIVVAQGKADNSPWGNICDATSDFIPTGNAKAHNGTLGDVRRKAKQTPIAALNVPVVTLEDLEEAESALNTSRDRKSVV